MKIPSIERHDYWRLIAVHASTKSNSAPWPVQLQLAALVGDSHAILASSAQFSTAPKSLWSVLAVTDDARLVKVVVEFEAEHYDLEAEQSFQEQSPAHSVIEAWVRRLQDVVSIEMRKAEFRRSQFNQVLSDQLDIGELTVKFGGDHVVVDLGINQLGTHYHEDRNRSDELIRVIRAHTGL
ncbi:hypothetical protein [Mycobacterium asiaticum]|uniref:hypothetical protein n=1 Tax=Mycobacterium asiaticum TaxID=1790 RepID=UPI0007EF8710|nr:hypothetical protein [Mycobacterium asiaticum]OBI90027.1 hypothetical protein A5661_03265 [Mycobacterium asiaticum]